MGNRVGAWLPLAWVLFVAAVFVAFVAQGFGAILCENGCEAARATVRRWQEWLPIVGLLPTVLVVAFVHKGQGRAAIAFLVVAILIYAAWGVALELLTHSREHGIDG
jgi:hypothetical protein